MTALLQGTWADVLNARVKEYSQRDALYSYALKDAASPYGLDTVISDDRFEVNEREMSIRFPYADGNRRDGVGDLLEVTGINLERHRLNPVCLFDHGKEVKLPVAKAEHPETKEYTVTLDGLAKTAFVKAYFYDGRDPEEVRLGNVTGPESKYSHAVFCEQLFDMMAKGYVRGGSIGYQVLQAKQLQPDYEKGTPQGLHLLKVLQLEASAVVMPANMDTVRKALDLKTVCGKPLSPYLVKSLQCYVPEKKAQLGYEGKPKALQYADGSVPKIGDRVRVGDVEGVLVRDYPAGGQTSARIRKDDGSEVDVAGQFAEKVLNGNGHMVGTKAQRDLSKTDVPPARWKPGVGAVKALRRKYGKGYVSSIARGAAGGALRGGLLGGGAGAALGGAAYGLGRARAAREGREYHQAPAESAAAIGGLAGFGAAFGGVGGAIRGGLRGYREERDRRAAKSIQITDQAKLDLERQFVERLRDALHASGVEGFTFSSGRTAMEVGMGGVQFGHIVYLPDRDSASESRIDHIARELESYGFDVERGGVKRDYGQRRQGLIVNGLFSFGDKYMGDRFTKGERVVLASPNLSSGGQPYNAGEAGTVAADSEGTVYIRMDDGEYVTALARDVVRGEKGYVSSILTEAGRGALRGGLLGTAAGATFGTTVGVTAMAQDIVESVRDRRTPTQFTPVDARQALTGIGVMSGLGAGVGAVGGGIRGAIQGYVEERDRRQKGMPNQQTALNMARDGAWDMLEDYLMEEGDGDPATIHRTVDGWRASGDTDTAHASLIRQWANLTNTTFRTRYETREFEPKEPIDWAHVAREIASLLGMVLLPVGTFAAGYGIAWVVNKVASLFETRGRKLSQGDRDKIAQAVEGEVKRRRQKSLDQGQKGLSLPPLPSLAEMYQKSLDLRQKYTPRDVKGHVRRLKKSRPGMSVIYVHPKDLALVKNHCDDLGVKFHHSKSAGDKERVTLTGHDEDVDRVARRWGQQIAPRRMNAHTKSGRR